MPIESLEAAVGQWVRCSDGELRRVTWVYGSLRGYDFEQWGWKGNWWHSDLRAHLVLDGFIVYPSAAPPTLDLAGNPLHSSPPLS